MSGNARECCQRALAWNDERRGHRETVRNDLAHDVLDVEDFDHHQSATRGAGLHDHGEDAAFGQDHGLDHPGRAAHAGAVEDGRVVWSQDLETPASGKRARRERGAHAHAAAGASLERHVPGAAGCRNRDGGRRPVWQAQAATRVGRRRHVVVHRGEQTRSRVHVVANVPCRARVRPLGEQRPSGPARVEPGLARAPRREHAIHRRRRCKSSRPHPPWRSSASPRACTHRPLLQPRWLTSDCRCRRRRMPWPPAASVAACSTRTNRSYPSRSGDCRVRRMRTRPSRTVRLRRRAGRGCRSETPACSRAARLQSCRRCPRRRTGRR